MHLKLKYHIQEAISAVLSNIISSCHPIEPFSHSFFNLHFGRNVYRMVTLLKSFEHVTSISFLLDGLGFTIAASKQFIYFTGFMLILGFQSSGSLQYVGRV